MITAEYKKTWMTALREGLKQNSYGSRMNCALCKQVDLPNSCRDDCICYIAPPHQACARRVPGTGWTAYICRAELRKMLAWLRKQKAKK